MSFDYVKMMNDKGHEELHFFQIRKPKAFVFIGIHNTHLGPALGGTRVWHYKNNVYKLPPFEAAIKDVLRLSEGMSYKASAAGVNLGGGKAVILCDPAKLSKNERKLLFTRYGEIVDSLNGKYITAEDVGTGLDDMVTVHKKTRYVCGLPTFDHGSGDPSPMTAMGILSGMKACAKHAFGTEDLNGKTVALQGLGHVGMAMARLLHEEGAKIVATDISKKSCALAKRKYDAKIVGLGAIYGVKCDIFCPCALGAIINDKTIKKFKCKVIAGSANNQLADIEKHGKILQKKKIIYAPDYVINAGGLINVSFEEGVAHSHYSRERAVKAVKHIYDRIDKIIKLSKKKRISTAKAANLMAERRLKKKRVFMMR